MNRFDALMWLGYELGPVYESFGRPLTDSSGGFGPAITYAARHMGASDTNGFVIVESERAKFESFLRVYALRPLLAAAAMQFDGSVDAPLTSIKDRGTFKNIRDMYDMALAEANLHGFNELATNVGVIKWNTDWTEPVEGTTESG